MTAARSQQKILSLQKLQECLQNVSVFKNPKLDLEQYPTTPHLAACMLHKIIMDYDDIDGRCIADLGVGCGVLGIGCCMLGAGYVLGLDIDKDALEDCRGNLKDQKITNMDLVQCDIKTLTTNSGRLQHAFDTVVMNPPFGTKSNEGIDVAFLKVGLDLSSSVVYSLLRRSTRNKIQRKAKQWGVEIELLAELRYDLSKTMVLHKKETKDIEVDLYRFSHKTKMSSRPLYTGKSQTRST